MKQTYGHTADGMPVGLHSLTNAGGMQVRTTGHRGIVTSLLAPDRNGRFDDVAPGFDELDGHLARHPKFGAVCGRAGRCTASATACASSASTFRTRRIGPGFRPRR